MRRRLVLLGLLIVAGAPSAKAQDGSSAAFLLPACRLYLQSEVRGPRLLLERGVCLGTIETVLRLHERLRGSDTFCPPAQVTLEAAVRVVVDFAKRDQNLDQPLVDLAIQAYRKEWPC